ncbi:MAG: GNAT family N-acetyltransferase [Clostridia bacterium]|nr:GNAT family N-acetyltransferase [Clostridia bacterium]
MIDKSVEDLNLILCKTDTKNYPRCDLPEGYSFTFYKKGDEYKWAQLEVELGQFKELEKAVEAFRNDFLVNQNLKPEDRTVFVVDPNGEYVATLSLWDGTFLGEYHQRLHWMAVSDKCAGKGIAKALMTRLLDLYNELGYKDFIFLGTETWYYPAISIYRKFGFIEYTGKTSVVQGLSDEEFKVYNERAIKIVNEKLEEYKKRK